MKKIFSLLCVVLLVSHGSLSYFVDKPVHAETINSHTYDELDAELQNIKNLIALYKKIDFSSSLIYQTQKAKVLKTIDEQTEDIVAGIEPKKKALSKTIKQSLAYYRHIQQEFNEAIKIIDNMNKSLEGMDEIFDELEESNKRLEENNKMLEENNKMLEENNKRLEEMNKRLAENNKKLVEMNKNLDSMAKDMNTVSKDMDKMSKSLNGLESELKGIDKIDFGTKEITSSLKGANKAMADMIDALDGANKAMDTMNAGVDSMNHSLDGVNSDIVKVNSALKTTSFILHPNDLNKKKIIDNNLNNIAKSLAAIDKIQNQKFSEPTFIKNTEDVAENLKTLKNTSSFVADLLPIVSQVKGAHDTVSGKDWITGEDLKAFDRTISGISMLGGGMIKLIGSTNKSLSAIEKVGVLANKEQSKMIGWSMPIGGGNINGRRYTQHVLERMAPDTEEVRKELTVRAHKKYIAEGYEVGSKEYNRKLKAYVQPRGITPTVVEDVIRNTSAIPGNKPDTFIHATDRISVMVNSNGDVITVIPIHKK